MSKQSNTAHYDEIDLFQTLHTLLNGKWIIITTCLVSLLIGVLYNFIQPEKYHVSIDVSEGSDSQFFRYIKLNDVLAKKPLPFKDVESSLNVLSKIFKKEEFKNMKIIDLRQTTQVILNG